MRQLAVANIEWFESEVWGAAAKQSGEHLAVIAGDVPESFSDVIAFE